MRRCGAKGKFLTLTALTCTTRNNIFAPENKNRKEYYIIHYYIILTFNL